MLKVIREVRDTYITNKIVRGVRKTESNVGAAGTLDLFKLYGLSLSGSTPNTELSRILVHFDLEEMKNLVEEKKIDFSDPSFWCKIYMRDVYGGQTVPSNFSVSVFPLSASFIEGIGKDVSYYSDADICNWVTSSLGTTWFVTGSGLACDAQTSLGDYITSSISLTSTEKNQTFHSGTEDLVLDVTPLISATLSGELPDSGFRISFLKTLEEDNQTYFVKRFASSQAYDESKRPTLVFGFDDSISDDSQNLTFDSDCFVNLYNYSGGNAANIVSGSSLSQVTGNNCVTLKMMTQVSGGYYNLYFQGSQFSLGSNHVSGVYQSIVNLPSNDTVIKSKLAMSGSVDFTPVWMSLDGTVAYVTGSTITARPPDRTSTRKIKNYSINVRDLGNSYYDDEEVFLRVNIFDQSSPLIKVVKVPVELPGLVIRDVYYQVRDAVTNEEVIPFDLIKKSTKLSSDDRGMFFKLYTSSLMIGRSYVVDILIDNNGVKTKFLNASPLFKIERRS